MNPDAPVASVVICTYNRATVFRVALESVVADRSGTPCEIIVVDNASTDDTRHVYEQIAATSHVAMRYLREPRLGQTHARNRGALEANGEVVIFTDDDVVVESGWVDALCRAFEDADVGAAGGRVKPLWPEEPPRWMLGPHAEPVTLPDFGSDPYDMPNEPGKLPVGANMAIRASLLKGDDPPFDPALGMVGALKIDSEEVLLMQRIASRHRVVYVPDAVVHHRIDRSRIDVQWLRRCYFQKGFGTARRERLASGPDPEAAALQGVAKTFRVVVRKVRETERTEPTADALGDELRGFYVLGREIDYRLRRWPRLANWVARHGARVPALTPRWLRRPERLQSR